MLALTLATSAAPAPGVDGPPLTSARPTTTRLVVAPGAAGGSTITVTVAAGESAGESAAGGSVVLLDAGRPVAVLPLTDGAASLTTALAADGRHELVARFEGAAGWAPSTSPVLVVGEAPATDATGTVTLTIPAGFLSVSSDATAAVELVRGAGHGRAGRYTGEVSAVVTDTRAGNLGFTVSVGLTGLDRAQPGGVAPSTSVRDVWAAQVAGNGLRSSDVHLTRGAVPLRHGQAQLAAYPRGLGVGSVRVGATVTSSGPVRPAVLGVVWTVI